MTKKHPFDRIMEALDNLDEAFLEQNIKPPSIFILPTRSAGHELIHVVRNHTGITLICDIDTAPTRIETKETYMELNLMHYKIRWPTGKGF